MSEPNMGPCPFCGGEDLQVMKMTKSRFWVGCDNCGATASVASTKQKAIAAWNKRAGEGE